MPEGVPLAAAAAVAMTLLLPLSAIVVRRRCHLCEWENEGGNDDGPHQDLSVDGRGGAPYCYFSIKFIVENVFWAFRSSHSKRSGGFCGERGAPSEGRIGSAFRNHKITLTMNRRRKLELNQGQSVGLE